MTAAVGVEDISRHEDDISFQSLRQYLPGVEIFREFDEDVEPALAPDSFGGYVFLRQFHGFFMAFPVDPAGIFR